MISYKLSHFLSENFCALSNTVTPLRKLSHLNIRFTKLRSVDKVNVAQ